jgi:uncharacterized protein YjbI with pentapeptide repeats
MPDECGYTHDVSTERFADMAGGTWVCTREAVADGDRCVFHAPVDSTDDATVRESLLEAVRNEQGALRLVGARLGALDLDYALLSGRSNHPIDLRDAHLSGEFSARYATVERPLRLEGASLARLDVEDATFERRVDFGETTFEGRVSLRMAEFKSWLDIRDASFEGAVYARVARFRRGIYGVDATFHAAADFLNTYFADVANFYRTTFRAGAVFNSSTFEGNAQFNEGTIDGPAVRLESASGSPRSERETIAGVALSIAGVTCGRDLRLVGTELGGDVRFTDSDLGRDLRCTEVSTTGEMVVDCSGSAVIEGTVDGEVTCDLTDAEVGELELGDGGFSATRFEKTTFSGFDFGAYKRELAARNWRLHGETDGGVEPEEIENLYLRAKNGASAVGETRAAAEFFIKEMTYRKAGHRRRALGEGSLGQRLRAAGRWLSNKSLGVTCGYGERPFRPVLFSLVLIVVFAVVYAALDAPITYAEPFGYLTFSTEGFVSLILGLPRVTGSALSFVLAFEGFLGGFIIALFVFTLTRSISR